MWTRECIICSIILTSITIGLVNARALLKHKRAFSYIANETVCVVDNLIYREGDPIPTDDPCEYCKCRPPGFSCVLRECLIKPGCKAIRRQGECCPEYQCGCEHNGHFFNDGDRIPNAESPCYSCYCQGSSITCALADCKFRFDCEPEYLTGECCPRYDHCSPEPTTSWISSTTISSVFTKPSSTVASNTSSTLSSTSVQSSTPFVVAFTTSTSTESPIVSSELSADSVHVTTTLAPKSNTTNVVVTEVVSEYSNSSNLSNETVLKDNLPSTTTNVPESYNETAVQLENELSSLNKTWLNNEFESNQISSTTEYPVLLTTVDLSSNKTNETQSKPNLDDSFILTPTSSYNLTVSISVDKDLATNTNSTSKVGPSQEDENVSNDQLTLNVKNTSSNTVVVNREESVDEEVLIKELVDKKEDESKVDDSSYQPVTTELTNMEKELKDKLAIETVNEYKSETTTVFKSLLSYDDTNLSANVDENGESNRTESEVNFSRAENEEEMKILSLIDNLQETGIKSEVILKSSEGSGLESSSVPPNGDESEGEKSIDFSESDLKDNELSIINRFKLNEYSLSNTSIINEEIGDELRLNDDIYPTTAMWMPDFKLSAEHKEGDDLIERPYPFLNDNYNLTFNSSLLSPLDLDLALDNITSFTNNRSTELMGP